MDSRSRPRRAQGAPFGDRERYHRAVDAPSTQGARALLGGFLALSVFLLILSLSVRQATQPAPAQRALQPGIASLTDLDLLLSEQSGSLKREAERGDASATFRLTAYPIDVQLSRNDVLSLSPSELRAVILARSAAVVYQRGLSAFDVTGRQSISLFSAQGLLDLVVGRLSSDTNDLASKLAAAFVVLTALLAVAVAARGEGIERLRALGFAVVVGALPGFLLTLLARFVAGRLGADPFVADLRAILVTLLGVPLRNYLVVALLGGFVVALEPGMRFAARFLPLEPAPVAGDGDWPAAAANPIADLEGRQADDR